MSQARGLGGSTRSLANVLEGLSGRACRVLASPAEGRFLEQVRTGGLIEEHIALPSPGGPQSWRISRPVGAARLVRWCRKNRSSLVAIHANGPEEINLAAPAALAARVPLVVWIHAFEVSPWTRRLGPLWRRALRNHPVHWLAVSGTAGGVLVEAGLTDLEAVQVVPNPIDSGEVVAASRPPHEGLTIGYVGSAERRKGFRMLPDVIDALADLPVHWLLFTNENSRDAADHRDVWGRLRAQPPERVTVVGKLDHIGDVYAGCDIVFCPSFKESFCRVAAEAMLNGLPVVASDLAPLRELLGRDEAGILFEPGDVDAAIAGLRRVATDPGLRVELGTRGRTRASAFVPAKVTESLASAYGLTGFTAGDPLDDRVGFAAGEQK